MGTPPRLDVTYDAACRLCRASRAWVEARDPGGRIVFHDLAADAASPADPNARSELVVIGADAKEHRGYAGWVEVLAALPAWKRRARLLAAPPLRWLGPACYRLVARLRGRTGGSHRA